jgi:serine/threonine protein kinase
MPAASVAGFVDDRAAARLTRRPPTPPASRPRFCPGDPIRPDLLACAALGHRQWTESWLAWSLPHWSHVVVKLPREEHTGAPRVARQLGREARMLTRLSHSAVRRLLADAHGDPVPHLVLEYVEGPTLAALLREEGPLAPGDVVRLGTQLASCLHFVHGRGIVHLDVRPDNVVLRDGRAVLLDFDLARPVGRPQPARRLPGSWRCLAPEGCLGAPADPRMDLFALGAVLYEVATGLPPFRAEDSARGWKQPQLLTVPPRARVLHPALPADVDVVIHALLEREVGRRPENAHETLRLLTAALPLGEEPAWPPYVDELLQMEGDA